MEENVQYYFLVFLLGLGAMVTLHNTILSIIKYFTRNYGKVSDMLRIICNNGGLLRFLLSLGYFMTPSGVTSTSCKALGYFYIFGFHLFHISLFAFLLWNIYRMSLNKKDLWFSTVFLLIQISFIIPEMIFARPSMASSSPSVNYCDLDFISNSYRIYTSIILALVMLFYVIIRLSYLVKNRRRNANIPIANKSINNDDNESSATTILAARRPLDLNTIYWALILSIFSVAIVLYSSLPDRILLMSDESNFGIVSLFWRNLSYIVISYVITYMDCEKRTNVIFYNCCENGRIGSENVRNSANKLDGEPWVICSKKERKKDSDGEMANNENNVNNENNNNQV